MKWEKHLILPTRLNNFDFSYSRVLLVKNNQKERLGSIEGCTQNDFGSKQNDNVEDGVVGKNRCTKITWTRITLNRTGRK